MKRCLPAALFVSLCLVLFSAAACRGQGEDRSLPQTSSAVSLSQAGPVLSGQAASQETLQTACPITRQAELAAARAGNSDTAAWLYLPGTGIDDPVMQAADNEYYLRRDENGSDSVWGCYFADCLDDLSSRDALAANTVIYGHSRSTEDPNDKKFTQLFRFCDLGFVRGHRLIYLSLPGEDLTFEIAAVFFTDTSFDYIAPEPGGSEPARFFETVNRKNEYIFAAASLAPGDRLLTLSTCAVRYDTENTGSGRLVIMSRLLGAGADPAGGEISLNPVPERP